MDSNSKSREEELYSEEASRPFILVVLLVFVLVLLLVLLAAEEGTVGKGGIGKLFILLMLKRFPLLTSSFRVEGPPASLIIFASAGRVSGTVDE